MKEPQHETGRELARKNIRLAIILGLVAFGFYIGFILMYLK